MAQILVPTVNGIIQKSISDHVETVGPRVGLRLTLDQATFILHKHGLSSTSVTFIYIDRGFNNRSYLVKTEDEEYVIRLTGNCWTRMKTENEVASIIYLSKKCGGLLPLPTILGYSSSKTSSGVGAEYILMTKLKGVPLDTIFTGLSFPQKKKVLEEVARLLGRIKKLTFGKIGSLQFSSEFDGGEAFNPASDNAEKVEVGPGLEAGCGPFPSYLAYLKATFTTELNHLRGCPFLSEDEAGSPSIEELIKRTETFVQVMCDPTQTKFGKDVTRVRTIFTHGDFEPRNILVDENTLEITGLVDFEFSGAFPEDDDWLAGFQWIGASTDEAGAFGEERESNPEILCNPEELHQLKEYFLIKCEAEGVLTPKNIPGHKIRALMYHFRGSIAPWWMREAVSPIPPEWFAERSNARSRIIQVLDQFGFY